MEKKRLFITFVLLVVGVILLALLTKFWLKSSGLDVQNVKNKVTKPKSSTYSWMIEHEYEYETEEVWPADISTGLFF
ncbi:MAG: hypothetical protein K5897_11535 [Eubacterium sp.]|nr:hypothetical protein [Eubacterium sp.]